MGNRTRQHAHGQQDTTVGHAHGQPGMTVGHRQQDTTVGHAHGQQDTVASGSAVFQVGSLY